MDVYTWIKTLDVHDDCLKFVKSLANSSLGTDYKAILSWFLLIDMQKMTHDEIEKTYERITNCKL